MGLDFTYSIAIAEELGSINCGAIPMAIGVQTDMATPALSRFGSDQLKRDYLAPTIAGDMVVCLGVSEPSAGSDVASKSTENSQIRSLLPFVGRGPFALAVDFKLSSIFQAYWD